MTLTPELHRYEVRDARVRDPGAARASRPDPVDRRVQRRAAASAPMRVSFAGGGTDVPPFLPELGGRVIGSAIDLRVRAMVEPFDRGWVRLEIGHALARGARRTEEPSPHAHPKAWRSAARGSRLSIAGGRARARRRRGRRAFPCRERSPARRRPRRERGRGRRVHFAAMSAAIALETAAPASLARERDALSKTPADLRLCAGSQDQLFAAFGGVLDVRYEEGGDAIVKPRLAAARARRGARGRAHLGRYERAAGVGRNARSPRRRAFTAS